MVLFTALIIKLLIVPALFIASFQFNCANLPFARMNAQLINPFKMERLTLLMKIYTWT